MLWADLHSFKPSNSLLWADSASVPGKPIVAGTFFQASKSIATNHSFQPANMYQTQAEHFFEPSHTSFVASA